MDKIHLIENRIASVLFAELRRGGWRPTAVDSGYENAWVPVATSAAAWEEVQSVEMASVEVKRDGGADAHYISLVCGNGVDLVCDWTYKEGDPDGFDAIMTRVGERSEQISDTATCWVPCPGCEGAWCTEHEEHVPDCACPPRDEELDAYCSRCDAECSGH